MARAKNYRELKVWQAGKDLTINVYNITKKYPSTEQFGLTSQTQRAAVSIPSNIAEGFGRHGSNEFKRFLSIAYGSVAELETQLTIANELKYFGDEEYDKLIDSTTQISKMLSGLIKSLRNSN